VATLVAAEAAVVRWRSTAVAVGGACVGACTALRFGAVVGWGVPRKRLRKLVAAVAVD
jgi:hypothetical protein